MSSSAYIDNQFKLHNCEGTVTHISDIDIVVRARIREPVSSETVSYIASAPPDFRATFTGSGLPFHTQRQAFDRTPNKGALKLGNGNSFVVKLKYPNSYYAGLGTVLIPPTLYVYYDTVDGGRVATIPVSKGIPYRMLTYPGQTTAPRKDAMFYAGGWEMPVRSQEQIIRDSAYPSVNAMPANFWGGKPPA
jgi:hypothetical protein